MTPVMFGSKMNRIDLNVEYMSRVYVSGSTEDTCTQIVSIHFSIYLVYHYFYVLFSV